MRSLVSGSRVQVMQTPPGTLEKKSGATEEAMRRAVDENQQLRTELGKREKELESLKAELAKLREQNKSHMKR